MAAKESAEGLVQARMQAALTIASDDAIDMQLGLLSAARSQEAKQELLHQLQRTQKLVRKYVRGLLHLADSIAGQYS